MAGFALSLEAENTERPCWTMPARLSNSTGRIRPLAWTEFTWKSSPSSGPGTKERATSDSCPAWSTPFARSRNCRTRGDDRQRGHPEQAPQGQPRRAQNAFLCCTAAHSYDVRAEQPWRPGERCANGGQSPRRTRKISRNGVCKDWTAEISQRWRLLCVLQTTEICSRKC